MPGETLAQFAPIDYVSKPIEFRDYLHPVVERIAQVIPKDVIWQLYASSPSETGGHIVFPYSRVNAAVMAARDYLRNVKLFPGDKIKLNQYYEKAAEQAFEALVWVEVGFQGLDNLANSPASNNWEG
ncbi:MAG: hypothetical protein NT149_02735, partial [Candidatus Gottesmanbacteria bacterium]|nr:hypothetical protein [Candidatus Gottesmanbacteria bacterium]